MTASRTPAERPSLISPVIDYEPPPIGNAACRSAPTLRRRASRPLHVLTRPPGHESPPPATVAFADASLRRVLEVIDRRRPVAQLRPLVAPALIDTVTALTRAHHTAAATLTRVRVRMVDDEAAELFATYTRAQRVRAIAGRIEQRDGRWRIVALQIG
jgi:uncharacterized protein DUF6459